MAVIWKKVLLEAGAYADLASNGKIGSGSTQLSQGNHSHSYLPLTGGAIIRTSSGVALALAGENYNVDLTLGHASGSTPDVSNGFIFRYLGTGSGDTGNLFQFKTMGWSTDPEATIFDVTQETVPKFDFKATPSVNGTAVSLSGHTHSYLPLAGGTVTGEFRIAKLCITQNARH